MTPMLMSFYGEKRPYMGSILSKIASAFTPAPAKTVVAKVIAPEIIAQSPDAKQVAAAQAISKDIAAGNKIATVALIAASTAVGVGLIAAPAGAAGVLGIGAKLASGSNASPLIKNPVEPAPAQIFSQIGSNWLAIFLKTYFGL